MAGEPNLAGPFGEATLQAYVAKSSFESGEKLLVHISDFSLDDGRSREIEIHITRIGERNPRFSSKLSITRQALPSPPERGAQFGANWAPVALSIPELPTGLYCIHFGGWGETTNPDVSFVIKPKADKRGNISKILLCIPHTTAQAYNKWGGASIYESSEKIGYEVSFHRPYYFSHENMGTEDDFDIIDRLIPLVTLMDKENILYECASDLDINDDSLFLANYQLFVSAGHDEYWSYAMKRNVEAFIAQGGNAAFFGGNTCWWKAVISEPQSRSLKCSHDAETELWCRSDSPQNRLTGLGFRDDIENVPRYQGFRVVEPHILLLNDNGKMISGVFGSEDEVVGYETDSAYTRRNSSDKLVVTGKDGTPGNFKILAWSDCSEWPKKYCEQQKPLPPRRCRQSGLSLPYSGEAGSIMGYYRYNGFVFTAGSVQWTSALKKVDSEASSITKNVLKWLRLWRGPYGSLQRTLVPVYAFVNSTKEIDYFEMHSTSPFMVGWNYSGVSFWAFIGEFENSVPMHQFKRVHMDAILLKYSTSKYSSDESYQYDGVAFHVLPFAVEGDGRSKKVFEFSAPAGNAGGLKYHYSTSENEGPIWSRTNNYFIAPDPSMGAVLDVE
jgi:hypothetical protein